MSKRYFLNNFDTYFGSSFLPLLFPEGPPSEPTLFATYKDTSKIDKPPGFKKILKREKPKLFRKRLFEECDVFVYNLHDADENDLSFIYEALSNANFEEQKLFLLISNVLTWAKSEKRVKMEEEKKEEDEPALNPDNLDDKPQEFDDQKLDSIDVPHPEISELDPSIDPPLSPFPNSLHSLPPTYLPFTDSDFRDRLPHPSFELEKKWEDLFLSLSKENLKVCVVCTGILYGEGEVIFKRYLEAAWKAEPAILPYLAPGHNIFPTMHIADLAKFVLKVAEMGGRQGEEKKNDYFIAIDKTGQKKLKELEEKEAAKKLEMENNRIEPEVKGTEAEDEENKGIEEGGEREILENVNEKTQEELESISPPTGYGRWLREIFSEFAQKVGNGGVEPIEELDPEWGSPEIMGIDLDMKGSEELWGAEDFEWRAEGGLGENAKKVMEEFEKKMKLRPIKVLIYCLEGARRKMNFSGVIDDIAHHYKIPILNIKNILQKALQEADPELIADLKEEIENIQIYLSSDKPEFLNEMLKVLYRAVKWRLSQNDCRNRGYILEDFPKFDEESKFIFEKTKALKRKKKKIVKPSNVSKENEKDNTEALDEAVLEENVDEAERPEEEEEIPLEDEIPEELEDASKKEEVFFPESVIILRDLAGGDKDTDVNRSALDYLEGKNIDVLLYDSSRKPAFETFEALRMYIERNGTPFNYLTPESELKQRHIDYYIAKNSEIEDEKQAKASEEMNLLQEAKKRREEAALEQVKFIFDFEYAENKSMHFREYLMEYIIPHVSAGLLEVSEYQPDDPIEFLSEYIYKKSFDI